MAASRAEQPEVESEGGARVMTLTEEMKPVLLVMRGINLMPLTFSADGGAAFSWRSRAALLTLLAWCVTVVAAAVESEYRLGKVVATRSFSEAVFGTFYLVALHHHFLNPVVHWLTAASFADYLADWTEFQAHFLRATGRPLRPAVRPLAVHKAAAILALPTIISVAFTLGVDDSTWSNVPLGFVATVFHACVPAFWAILGAAVVNASDSLSSRFLEEVQLSRGRPPAQRVLAYRELWLELRSLAERTAAAWGLGTMHYLLSCIACVLLNGFGLLAEATQSAAADPVMSTAMLLVTVDSLWHTAVVCRAGQRMASSVNAGARDVLLAVRPSRPQRDGPDSSRLHQEVKSFLNVMKKPLVISLFGFFTLEVTLIVTVVNTLVTYLCVLLQFTINFQMAREELRKLPTTGANSTNQ